MEDRHYIGYISQKSISLSTIDKIHLKSDAFDGSVVNGLGKPMLSVFSLDKPPGCKLFCEPETIYYKKINKFFLNTISFYLEDDDHKEVILNGEALTFTLQSIKL